MEENIIFIKCPKCGAILRLQSKPGLEKLTLACPVCKEKQPFVQYQRVVKKAPSPTPAPEEDKTDIRIPAPDPTKKTQGGEATQIISNARLVMENGQIYKLSEGKNVIGRKATSSPATLQIDTQDMHMSRDHAIIDVIQSGGKQLYMFKNSKNKNDNYINGKKVEPGDVIMLNDNDKISFSTVNAIFKTK